MKVAFQGVRGAYSEIAALKYFKTKDINFFPKVHFADIFKAVQDKKVDFGIIPIENSWAGSIVENCDHLVDYNVWIEGEEKIAINHSLMIRKKQNAKDIRKVISHPQALAQCEKYIKKNKYSAESFFDTAGAAEHVMNSDEKDLAAIASEQAAKDFGLKIIDKKIQDSSDNYTRFFIIRRKKRTDDKLQSRNKTSLAFSFENVPGALHKALSIFSIRDIDLSKIESRPVKSTKWNYRFYVDVMAGYEEEKLKLAIRHLEEIACEVKVLGSYKLKS